MVLTVVSVALYIGIVCATRPQDIHFGEFWRGYFATPDEPLAFTAATLVYLFGVILLVLTFYFVPRHRPVTRCLMGVSGLLCGAFGLFLAAILMIDSFDLFHP